MTHNCYWFCPISADCIFLKTQLLLQPFAIFLILEGSSTLASKQHPPASAHAQEHRNPVNSYGSNGFHSFLSKSTPRLRGGIKSAPMGGKICPGALFLTLWHAIVAHWSSNPRNYVKITLKAARMEHMSSHEAKLFSMEPFLRGNMGKMWSIFSRIKYITNYVKSKSLYIELR